LRDLPVSGNVCLMETITFAQVKPSDTIIFFETPFKVRSVIVKTDRVEVTYWETNSHYPYFYDPTEKAIRLTA
jgi:hypothetical protein